jgi:ABC-type phosphate transport system substrate-binding protein
MKRSGAVGVVLFTVVAFVPCYAHHLAVVVAKDNKVEAVTSASLARMFRAETKKWPDGQSVILVLHQDSDSQMQTLERLNKMSESNLRAFLASHKNSVVLVDTDSELLKIVETVPGAIGLVDVRSINDKVKVLKVDGKLPLENGYLPHH